MFTNTMKGDRDPDDFLDADLLLFLKVICNDKCLRCFTHDRRGIAELFKQNWIYQKPGDADVAYNGSGIAKAHDHQSSYREAVIGSP